MINEEIKIEKKVGGDYSPLPENIYQVQLVDIEVQEKPAYKNPDQSEKVLSFKFATLAGKDKDGNSLRGRLVWKNFVPLFLYVGKNGKNALYQITEALIGRDLTKEEEVSMGTRELNALIGMQCRIVVKNKAGKDNKVFNNIETLLPIEQKMVSLTNDEVKKLTEKKTSTNENIPLPEETYQENSQEIIVENLPF